MREKRKGPISRAGGLVDSVAATVRRMQRDREPRVLAYDPTGYARLVQPEARGHERILEIGEEMVALAAAERRESGRATQTGSGPAKSGGRGARTGSKAARTGSKAARTGSKAARTGSKAARTGSKAARTGSKAAAKPEPKRAGAAGAKAGGAGSKARAAGSTKARAAGSTKARAAGSKARATTRPGASRSRKSKPAAPKEDT